MLKKFYTHKKIFKIIFLDFWAETVDRLVDWSLCKMFVCPARSTAWVDGACTERAHALGWVTDRPPGRPIHWLSLRSFWLVDRMINMPRLSSFHSSLLLFVSPGRSTEWSTIGNGYFENCHSRPTTRVTRNDNLLLNGYFWIQIYFVLCQTSIFHFISILLGV